METKTFTVDNILVILNWGSDKKVYVHYLKDNNMVDRWQELEVWQGEAISSYCKSYCKEFGLTLWSY